MGYSKTAYRIDYKDYEQFKENMAKMNDFIFSIEKGFVSADMPNTVLEMIMSYLSLEEYQELPLFGEQTICSDMELFLEYGTTSIDFSGIETVKRIATILNPITWESLYNYYKQHGQHLTGRWSKQGYEKLFFANLKMFYVEASTNQQVVIAYSGF